MRVLELFSGIGGCAAALNGRAEVIAAVDQHERANAVYRHNHPDTPIVSHNLNHARPEWFRRFEADLWWMSPPCRPHTIRGPQRDLDDPRSQSFRSVVAAIAALRPTCVALENVPWFDGSDAHALLRSALEGYDVRELVVCPTELGVPNSRRRFYLIAGREPLDPRPRPSYHRRLAAYLGPGDPDLLVEPELRRKYDGALHVVDDDDPHAIAACFTSAYGRSPVYSGSYLRQGANLRRFSPREIAAFLHFPDSFAFPPGMTLRHRWDLVGNSLSIAAVRHVLRAIPALADLPP